MFTGVKRRLQFANYLGYRGSSTAEMKKKSAQIPTSATAKRMATIMHRQHTTKWAENEIKAFRKLLPIEENDLAILERYYSRNWPPRTNVNHLRHDLATLLNHFAGELDRARIWCDSHKPKQIPRKIIPLPVLPEQAMTPEERLQAEADFERLCGRKPKWGRL